MRTVTPQVPGRKSPSTCQILPHLPSRAKLAAPSTVSAPYHYFGSNYLMPYSTTPKFLVDALRSAYCLWSYIEQGPNWGPKIEQTLTAALRPSHPRGEERPVGWGPPPLRTGTLQVPRN